MNMTQVGIVRCEKNMDRCPPTNCLHCLRWGTEGSANHDESQLVGIFTCRCPGENAVELARILKSWGAQAIHLCTCTFAKKVDGVWRVEEGGFCNHINDIIAQVHRDANIRCVKGTAHLPNNYELQSWA
jgi:predicted metal-binding protein